MRLFFAARVDWDSVWKTEISLGGFEGGVSLGFQLVLSVNLVKKALCRWFRLRCNPAMRLWSQAIENQGVLGFFGIFIEWFDGVFIFGIRLVLRNILVVKAGCQWVRGDSISWGKQEYGCEEANDRSGRVKLCIGGQWRREVKIVSGKMESRSARYGVVSWILILGTGRGVKEIRYVHGSFSKWSQWWVGDSIWVVSGELLNGGVLVLILILEYECELKELRCLRGEVLSRDRWWLVWGRILKLDCVLKDLKSIQADALYGYGDEKDGDKEVDSRVLHPIMSGGLQWRIAMVYYKQRGGFITIEVIVDGFSLSFFGGFSDLHI
ncbi:predicted protein [Arabidopsis lyrata subsp. lyrata]|uniref:Predicted protein n=1 Tax=Arabidopsis lyrata subsp. lyrata TaxID=81972 RepID=D7MUY8_ARALL|nr:predicted protein [Arabidopsis lyrata subsp. lyrata]